MPLPDEADPTHSVFGRMILPTVPIPQDPQTNPQHVAAALAQRFTHKRVVVLVPGQRFDSLGNRHGRGGGWYDRFLAAVPADWIRV